MSSIATAIVGGSGSGKSHSIQFLNPDTTYVINADQKHLPFKKALKIYKRANKNYHATSNVDLIMKKLKTIDKSPKANHIKRIVIDTTNAIMQDDEMARMKEKGFDKSICRIKTSLIAGNSLEIQKLQRN